MKLRIWSEKYSQMVFAEEYDFSSDYLGAYVDEIFNEFNVTEKECMWWSGLVDKNGVDIYPEDIVMDKDGIGVVRFIAPSFVVITKDSSMFSLGGGKVYPVGQNKLEDTEVIGNTFENSNLL